MRTFAAAVCVFLVGCGAPTSTVCGPSNCMGCCDANGACNAGVSPTACGALGASCDVCGSAQQCTGFDCVDRQTTPQPTDAGVPLQDCKAAAPKSQTLSAPCCTDWGRDACGALLFCAALDGRTQTTCYPERSRLDQTTCPSDEACASGSCNAQVGRCRSHVGAACTPSVGCATAVSGAKAFCDTSSAPNVCTLVGDGTTGAPCESNPDCLSNVCGGARCKAGPGARCQTSDECGPDLACSQGTCLAMCTGLVCSSATAPLDVFCQDGSVLTPTCPTQPPSGLSCVVSAYRADHTAMTVKLSWSGAASDGFDTRCTGPNGYSSRFFKANSTNTNTNREIGLYDVVQGRQYTCAVATLTHVNQFWLRSPTASCTVTMP